MLSRCDVEMKIVEVYSSISGEAPTQGVLTTFVRLAGCNLECWKGYRGLTGCDTPFKDEYREQSVGDVVAEIEGFKIAHVLFTGGEPLLQWRDVSEVISRLGVQRQPVTLWENFSIETNGTVSVAPFLKSLPCGCRSRTRFVSDVKTPSSGYSKIRDIDQQVDELDPAYGDCLKFVVGDQDDLKFVDTVLLETSASTLPCYVSPLWGIMDPLEIVEWMKTSKWARRGSVSLSLQIHKILWDPVQRGV